MQPGVIAGRYTVLRAVGRGGMGTVWLCRDEVLGREVAVKQVGTMPGETSSDVRRALREARSSAGLNHPNVVSIFDAVEDGDLNWLVMEYVPSRTLAEVLEQEGPIAPERAVWIGLQVADGLAAAHARGTMHRDVKPSNILVTDDERVKITDFGIARTHGDAQLTSTGLITGTPAYFAPETARGEEPGMPADVWALGATLYAAVEGNPPYPEQGNALALLVRIASESAPLPRRAGLLTEAINRMMDRDPAARWTMADAAHVLRRLHDQGVSAAHLDRTGVLPVVAAPPIQPTQPTRPTPTPPEPTAVRAEPRPVPVATAGDDGGRRRGVGWLPWAAVLLLAGLAFVVALLVNRDDEPTSGPGTAVDTSGASAPASTGEPTTDPPETDPETSEVPSEETAPPEPPPEEEPEDVPTGDAAGFGQRYYALLPGDTAAAYALLSPSYGSTFEQYDAFWSTIEALEVRGVTVVDDTTVDVAITYVTGDGAEDETRRLFLEPVGDDFVIVGDEAV